MDQVTAAVRQQYEAFPFPDLPFGALADLTPGPSSYRFGHYYCTHRLPATQAVRILDAGCGTGFSTLKLRQANPDAEIVAVDLSEASLVRAQARLAAAGYGSDAVTFLQADLQHLPDLGTPFDYIHCTGVLHHLPTPQRGLNQLKSRLKPDGVMCLMLYSGPGRALIREVQQLLRQLWDGQDLSEGLMVCRTFWAGLPTEHPYKQDYQRQKKVLADNFGAEFADSDAFLVDTYLQVCEQALYLPDVFALLAVEQLCFLRFLDEADWAAQRFFPGLPDYVAALSLPARYALVDRLRTDRNYTFYASPQAFERPALTWLPDAIPEPSPLIRMSAEQAILENGLGQQLPLTEVSRAFWKAIDGQQSWRQICFALAPSLGFSEVDTEVGLRGLMQALLEHYFVLQH
jgi:SAM-dependent methyltransferase